MARRLKGNETQAILLKDHPQVVDFRSVKPAQSWESYTPACMRSKACKFYHMTILKDTYAEQT